MKTRSETRATIGRPIPCPRDGHQVVPALDSANHAFSIDLIREKILDYAIHSGDISLQDLRSCRLVHSSSLETISKLLRFNREPLFYFSLEQDNPLLDQFIGTIKPDPNTTTLPFKLYLQSEFFIQPNFQHLVRLLTQCGDGLVELDILFPADGGSMFFFFPAALHLPLLQQIMATFSELDENTASGQTAGLMYLLQPILHGCQELKTFHVPFESQPGLNPAGFANLILPPTLTQVDLCYQFGNKELQILVTNPLPKLKKMRIPTTTVEDKNSVIFQILENCRQTLEFLILQGFTLTHDAHSRRSPASSSFPVMPKLQHLVICTLDWHLPEGLQKGSLQQCLPKLQELSLTLDCREIEKWTKGQRLNTVSHLNLRLMFLGATEDPLLYSNWSISPYDIDCVSQAFPNMTTLDILVAGRQLSGLKYLFASLTNLTDLTIEVRDTESVRKCLVWDSLLVGNLKKNKPSIRNLKELQNLSLGTVASPPDLLNVSLISGAVFTRALLKMPKLTKLVFRGRFRVTPHMKQKWERQQNGREMFYYEEEEE